MDPRLSKLDSGKLLTSLADFILPRVCLCCSRQLLPQEKHLCCGCLAELPLTHFWQSGHNPMADKFNARLEGVDSYQWAAALFHYDRDGGYDNIPQSLKYGRNFGAGSYFGAMLGRALALSPFLQDVDLVSCVPLHWSRRFKRGYNQAELVARAAWKEIAKLRGRTQFDPVLLARTRRTSTQTRLGVEEKAANVSGAFALREGRLSENVRHVLLIDDVFTTGATLAACANALVQSAGPSVRISAAALAYVGD